MHLSRYLSFWAHQRANELVLVCEEERLTWAEFDAVAEGVAAHLAEMGVNPGDRIGCLLGNSLEWCVAVAASFKVGSIFVPLNMLYGTFELAQIAADSECSVIVSTPELIVKLESYAGDRGTGDDVLLYDVKGSLKPSRMRDAMASGRRIPDPCWPDDVVAMLCYTSGTTGVPKGVMLTHRAIETMTNVQGLAAGWNFNSRILIIAPLAFTGGILCTLTPALVQGASVYVERNVDPERALDLVIKHKLTYLGGVPAMWQRFAEAPQFAEADLSGMAICSVGGAPVPRWLADLFLSKGVSIRNQYGTTETVGYISMPDVKTAVARPESQGRPLPSHEIELRDDEGRPVPQGEIGEVCLRGPQMMKGYWRKPKETAAAFDGDWYKSGDLGRIDEHGDLVLLDRKKNMLISGGVNVYPAEVERAMSLIPGVIEVVVFGLPSHRLGQEVVAIVHAPDVQDAALLIARTRELIGAYKAPKQIALSPVPLPRTSSNKLARQGLPELFAALLPGHADQSQARVAV